MSVGNKFLVYLFIFLVLSLDKYAIVVDINAVECLHFYENYYYIDAFYHLVLVFEIEFEHMPAFKSMIDKNKAIYLEILYFSNTLWKP